VSDKLRQYIFEQIIIEQRGQLNEIDPKAILGKIRNFGSSEKSINNRKIAAVLSQTFEGEFAKYLYKKLIEAGKGDIDILKTLASYEYKPNPEDYQKVFRLIGVPMLSYFVDKTFGEASIGGKIKQYTPFMSKVSTGNSELDRHVFEALGEVIRNDKVREMLQTNLEKVLKGKLSDLSSSQEYQELIASVLPSQNATATNTSAIRQVADEKAESVDTDMLTMFSSIGQNLKSEKDKQELKQYQTKYVDWAQKEFLPKFNDILKFLQRQTNENKSLDFQKRQLNEVDAKDFVMPEIQTLAKILDDGEEMLDDYFDTLNLSQDDTQDIRSKVSKILVNALEKLNTIDKKNLHNMMITLLDVGDMLDLKKIAKVNTSEGYTLNEGYFGDKFDEFKGRYLKGNIERNKWKILDDVLDNLPNLRQEIKREIKTAVFSMDYQDIEKMFDSREVKKRIEKKAELVSMPILKYIVKNSKGLYLKDEAFKSMTHVLDKIFTDEAVVNHVKGNIEIFIKGNIQKAKEIEAAKQKRKK